MFNYSVVKNYNRAACSFHFIYTPVIKLARKSSKYFHRHITTATKVTKKFTTFT